MIYISNEGALFRGFSRGWPTEVWDEDARKFTPYTGSVPKPIEWGDEISEEEARQMMGELSGERTGQTVGDAPAKPGPPEVAKASEAPQLRFLQIHARRAVIVRIVEGKPAMFWNRRRLQWEPFAGKVPVDAFEMTPSQVWRWLAADYGALDFGSAR